MDSLCTFYVDNGEGWQIALTRVIDETAFNPKRRPLLIVPGYGMNSFIFGYHPNGPSMMDSLAAQGYEVWTADFRTLGRAKRLWGTRRYRLEDIACTDLRLGIERILEVSETSRDKVDLLGCSLGGTYLFIYLACGGEEARERIGAVVSMGSPLRWEKIHPALRLAFGSPWLMRHVPMVGIRPLSAAVLPLLAKIPRVIGIYLHPDHVDISRTDQFVRTVEDPNPVLNEELARWLKTRDLIIRGVNVTEAMHDVKIPVLTVIANADGIVPLETAMSVHEHFGAEKKEVLRVGDSQAEFAHADLFLSNLAQERVFKPIGKWLAGVE